MNANRKIKNDKDIITGACWEYFILLSILRYNHLPFFSIIWKKMFSISFSGYQFFSFLVIFKIFRQVLSQINFFSFFFYFSFYLISSFLFYFYTDYHKNSFITPFSSELFWTVKTFKLKVFWWNYPRKSFECFVRASFIIILIKRFRHCTQIFSFVEKKIHLQRKEIKINLKSTLP